MPRPALPLLVAALLAPLPGSAQSVVVDEGSFAVTLAGGATGTERFTIRRAGVGDDAIVIANAVIDTRGPGGAVEFRPLLEVTPLDDASTNYQLKVSGAESAELSVRLAGRRYVARIQTGSGEEEREFLARPGTRIVEEGVAHHYYFLRSLRPGASTSVIEPRTRRQFQLTVSSVTDEEVRIGASTIPGRRVTFSAGGEVRHAWYDVQGRLLRVEIPSVGYVAQRTDLAG